MCTIYIYTIIYYLYMKSPTNSFPVARPVFPFSPSLTAPAISQPLAQLFSRPTSGQRGHGQRGVGGAAGSRGAAPRGAAAHGRAAPLGSRGESLGTGGCWVQVDGLRRRVALEEVEDAPRTLAFFKCSANKGGRAALHDKYTRLYKYL